MSSPELRGTVRDWNAPKGIGKIDTDQEHVKNGAPKCFFLRQKHVQGDGSHKELRNRARVAFVDGGAAQPDGDTGDAKLPLAKKIRFLGKESKFGDTDCASLLTTIESKAEELRLDAKRVRAVLSKEHAQFEKKIREEKQQIQNLRNEAERYAAKVRDDANVMVASRKRELAAEQRRVEDECKKKLAETDAETKRRLREAQKQADARLAKVEAAEECWRDEKARVAKTFTFDTAVVVFNTGERHLTIRRKLLLEGRGADSMFSAYLSGRHAVQTLKDGSILIESFPTALPAILAYLRGDNDPSLWPSDVTQQQYLLEAADFYQVKGFEDAMRYLVIDGSDGSLVAKLEELGQSFGDKSKFFHMRRNGSYGSLSCDMWFKCGVYEVEEFRLTARADPVYYGFGSNMSSDKAQAHVTFTLDGIPYSRTFEFATPKRGEGLGSKVFHSRVGLHRKTLSRISSTDVTDSISVKCEKCKLSDLSVEITGVAKLDKNKLKK